MGLACLPELNNASRPELSATANVSLAYHFIAGPGSLTLELCKLSSVVDGDEQLPDGQERNPNQEDTANHGQQDSHGVGCRSTLWRGQEA